MKKVLAVVVSLVLTMFIVPVSVFAEDVQTENGYGGVIPLTREQIDAHLLDESFFNSATGTRSSLPSSIDLSTSQYFPVIGDQGEYAACVAWSSVYYMYTYEVNRLHGTSAKTIDANGNVVNNEQNVYSPTWSYSLIARNAEWGLSRESVFEFSKSHGQLPLAHFPQYSDEFSFRTLPNDLEDYRTAIVNSLSTRVSDWLTIPVDTTESSITSPTSSLLDTVKRVLSWGYVLGADMRWGEPSYKVTNNGEKCAYRFERDCGAHAVTIVGYDDTIECDINGNGEIEGSEKGAFKIANSKGIEVENHNQGYLWVCYDALNLNTAVSGDWEDEESGTRNPAFSFIREGGVGEAVEEDEAGSDPINVFMAIQVQDYVVNYACVAIYNVLKPYQMQTYLRRSDENGVSSLPLIDYKMEDYQNNFVWILAFEYAALADPISDYLSGYTWKIELADGMMQASITDCVMVDDLNNTIQNYTHVSNHKKWECSLDLEFGDIDYDGVLTTADALMLLQYVNGNMDFSNVQTTLADVNDDGVVNTSDATLLYQQVNSGGEESTNSELVDLTE